MARGEHPRRIPPLVPALVAVVVAIGLVLLVGTTTDDEPQASATTTTAPDTTTTEGSTTTTTRPEPVDVAELVAPPPEVDAPTAYRITYDVVENGLPRVEEWTVRRPYEALITSTREGVLLSGTSTSLDVYQTFLSQQRGWLPVQPELHRAANDLHPAAAVAAMEALGLAERAGEEEVAGRRCSVFRTGQPPSAGPATPPSDDERTDLCIDGAGLVLRERWEIGGTVARERIARTVEVEPAIDPATFSPGPVVEDAEGLQAAFAAIAVPADEETLAGLRTDLPVPGGYRDDGAVFRSAVAGTSASGGPGSAEVVRFYSSGPALLEVAEVTVDGPADLGGGTGAPVEVDGWDEVWFEPGFRTSFLRARLDGSSFLELRHHDVAFLFEVLGTVERR